MRRCASVAVGQRQHKDTSGGGVPPNLGGWGRSGGFNTSLAHAFLFVSRLWGVPARGTCLRRRRGTQPTTTAAQWRTREQGGTELKKWSNFANDAPGREKCWLFLRFFNRNARAKTFKNLNTTPSICQRSKCKKTLTSGKSNIQTRST